MQILNAFVAVALRKLAMPWEEVLESRAIRSLCLPPVPQAVETHEAALKVARQRGYRIYGSLIVAAATKAGHESRPRQLVF